MDAFLAAEAKRAFDALSAVSSDQTAFGLLLGHKRGRRYFVEKIFPAPGDFEPTLENLIRLDKVFGGKVIGFYAAGSRRRELKARLRQPYAGGRLYLDVRMRKYPRTPAFRASLIDFDKRFLFAPLPLILED